MNEEWWNPTANPIRSGYSVVDTVTLEERELSVQEANFKLRQECEALRTKMRDMKEKMEKLQVERNLLMEIVLKK
jgi:hypothetical protein